MKRELDLSIHPDFINDYSYLKNISAQKLEINPKEITAVRILKRSIDARRFPVFRVKVIVYVNEEPANEIEIIKINPVKTNKSVIIIGSGPAGLFAALRLLELGVKPVILERGKDVRTRRRDLKTLQQQGRVNPDSNYCFGEGGAGTYSDGKLYTRSTKRGNVNRILNLFVQHGAPKEILIDSHPHIGSNKLPRIIESIRNTVITNGGEIYFDSRVTELIVKDKKILGAATSNGKEFLGDSVLLAAGHSARDIYYLLDKKSY